MKTISGPSRLPHSPAAIPSPSGVRTMTGCIHSLLCLLPPDFVSTTATDASREIGRRRSRQHDAAGRAVGTVFGVTGVAVAGHLRGAHRALLSRGHDLGVKRVDDLFGGVEIAGGVDAERERGARGVG